MSAANLLTHFPVSSLPSKLHRLRFPNSLTLSFCIRHRCSFRKLLPSSDFLSGVSANPRKGRLMAERVSRLSALGSGDGEEKRFRVLEQEALVDGPAQIRSDFASAGFEATLNRLSKWLVAGLFAAVLLCRHDAEALWAAMGSVLNSALSIILKRILNQERPDSHVRSDPGMPSSHAQSIFYCVMFVILSMVEWLGVNEVTLIFAALSLAFGSYLSWLRVTQQLHTISQVVVGAVLGSCFSLLWILTWDVLVLDAFNSNFWVQLSVFLGFAICGLGFLFYVVRYWFADER
ncbi:hypothetical protein Cgig2_019649 [Carnegiea gigantea]|uniref:Phosphatidic acid phosphatase type 2/haloperoxidase domain-containing protein n=1 Tax=Carnegiea gigantea TaxID=171969 RepID=A0A9Q1QIP9_9CARY|nr:hypothetical protein Cgig2_019649 [Carnegiea gigantea]